MRHAPGDRLGLSTTDRRRRDLLEERRADREVAEANGWDVDERAAEAEEIELAGIKAREGCWDVEVTGAAGKRGRSQGGRTPMRLLADPVDTYEAIAMARWWEWEEATDGRRQLTRSRGQRDLRALAGLGQEATDEEIVDEDQEADVRLALTTSSWDWIRQERKETELLEASERDGLGGARGWLLQRGLSWTDSDVSSVDLDWRHGRYPYG